MDEAAHLSAARLLELLKVEPDRAPGTADHPALAWRRAGLMAVTGQPDGPGLVCPAPLAAAADGALLALRALARNPDALPRNGALLLGERARLLGLGRRGRISANGSCRLIDTADGRIALSLARAEDWELAPILFMTEEAGTWSGIDAAASGLATADVMTRGIELCLPIAEDRMVPPPDSPFGIEYGPAIREKAGHAPLVLDFSALWAGPLAGSLLAMLGADVIKVESNRRPDGARRGHAGFYDLLNGAKRSVAIDFADAEQLRRLRNLVDRVDIVIEASRPHALHRLGIDRQSVVAGGGIWVSISAHDDPVRVGFGDDAAVGGGLAAHMAQGWGTPMFAGDAIADPLTGLQAALAAWALWRDGRSGLVRLSLAGTIAYACGNRTGSAEKLRSWQALAEGDAAALYPLRVAAAAAPASGADNRFFA